MNLIEKIKWDVVRKNVVVPLSTRIGTFVTGYLVALGANPTPAHAVGLGVAGAGLIIADLTVSWIARKSLERRTMQQAVTDVFAQVNAREVARRKAAGVPGAK